MQDLVTKKFINKIKSSKVVFHIKEISNVWSGSEVSTYGAAVGYYTIFSVAPLLVIAISISSIFIKANKVQDTILAQFDSLFGQSGASFIQFLIRSKESPETGVIFSVVGFIVLLFGAMGIFSELQKALDSIFENLPARRIRGIWAQIREKVLSVGMVLAVGFLLLMSLVFSAMMAIFSDYIVDVLPMAKSLIVVSEIVISFAATSFLFGLLYKILPSKKLAWKPAIMGGVVVSTMFIISKFLIGWYLSSSTAFSGFGEASALILFILWTYYMSQVFFLGAVLIRLYIIPNLKKNE